MENKLPLYAIGGAINEMLNPLAAQYTNSFNQLNEEGVDTELVKYSLGGALEGGLNPTAGLTNLLGEQAGGIAGAGMSLLNLVPGGSLVSSGVGALAGGFADMFNSGKEERELKKQEFERNRVKAHNSTIANISGAQYTKPTFEMGGELDEIEGNKHTDGGTNIGDILEAEKGETMKDRFIFSDKIKINKSMIKENEKLKEFEGMTIAEASKKIESKFKLRRTDPIDEKEKENRLNDLKLAQEIEKLKKETSKVSKNISSLLNGTMDELKKYEDGGGFDPNDPRNSNPLIIDGKNTGYTYGQFYKYFSDDKGNNVSPYFSKYGFDYNAKGEHMDAFNAFDEAVKSGMVENPDNGDLKDINIEDPLYVFQDQQDEYLNALNGNETNKTYNNLITPTPATNNNALTNSNNTNNSNNFWQSLFNKDKRDKGTTDKDLEKLLNSGYKKADRWGNLGNYWDIGRGIYGLLKDDKSFDRLSPQQVNPSFLDPTRAIQDVNNAYSSANESLSSVSSGIGSYLSNRLGLVSSQAKAVSGIESNYANQNAQIGNQAKQFNAQQRLTTGNINLGQQRYEEMVNQQERDVASNMISGGLGNLGVNKVGLIKDQKTDAMQMLWKDFLSSGRFKYEDGTFKVIAE